MIPDEVRRAVSERFGIPENRREVDIAIFASETTLRYSAALIDGLLKTRSIHEYNYVAEEAERLIKQKADARATS